MAGGRPTRLSSLAPGSKIVALARRTSDRDVPDLWTADETTPETSFTPHRHFPIGDDEPRADAAMLLRYSDGRAR